MITLSVTSTSSGVRYMTTPSQTQVVGRVGSWAALDSASSSASRWKSTGTNRMLRAVGVSASARARLSCWVSGWSTSNTTASPSSGIRHARPSRPAPRITTCEQGVANRLVDDGSADDHDLREAEMVSAHEMRSQAHGRRAGSNPVDLRALRPPKGARRRIAERDDRREPVRYRAAHADELGRPAGATRFHGHACGPRRGGRQSPARHHPRGAAPLRALVLLCGR